MHAVGRREWLIPRALSALPCPALQRPPARPPARLCAVAAGGGDAYYVPEPTAAQRLGQPPLEGFDVHCRKKFRRGVCGAERGAALSLRALVAACHGFSVIFGAQAAACARRPARMHGTRCRGCCRGRAAQVKKKKLLFAQRQRQRPALDGARRACAGKRRGPACLVVVIRILPLRRRVRELGLGLGLGSDA